MPAKHCLKKALECLQTALQAGAQAALAVALDCTRLKELALHADTSS